MRREYAARLYREPTQHLSVSNPRTQDLRDPSMSMVPTLGPEGYEYYLPWAIWIPRNACVCRFVGPSLPHITCVYTYICIYIYIYISAYIYIYICILFAIFLFIHLFVYLLMYTYINTLRSIPPPHLPSEPLLAEPFLAREPPYLRLKPRPGRGPSSWVL